MLAGPDVVFEAVPWANDVQPRFVERKTAAFSSFVDHFRNARDDLPLADGSALMRTGVQIRVQFPFHAEDADRGVAYVDYQTAAFRHTLAGADISPLRCCRHGSPKLAANGAYCMLRIAPYQLARTDPNVIYRLRHV